MLIKLILILALLALLFSTWHKIKRLPPARRKEVTLKIILGGVITVLVLGVVTGRMHWLGMVIAGLIPLARFGMGTAMRLIPMWLSRTGGIASFKTEFLDVQVAVQQGRISGVVLKGEFEGERIESLTDEQLDKLEAIYKEADMRSYYLIRIARQRRAQPGGDNRYSSGGAPPPFSNPAREEALSILGLKGNPTREEIIGAHRRLINKLHPDRGGSDFLAARVNQAKDVLLGKP